MQSKTQSLKVGAKVIHPHHGGGKVKKIVRIPERTGARYYEIESVIDNSFKHYVPVEGSQIMTGYEIITETSGIRKSIQTLKKGDFKGYRSQLKMREEVEALLSAGNLAALTDGLGILLKYHDKKIRQGKRLNYATMNLLRRTIKVYTSYLALLRDIKYVQAQKEVETILGELSE